MPGKSWGDDELRRFVLGAAEHAWLSDEEVADARAAARPNLERIVGGVQKRLLAEVGVTISREGIVLLATRIIEGSGDPRKFWVVVSTTPWEQLEEWIGDELIDLYRRAAKASKKSKRDKRALKGIEAASTRREIE